jgi:hypothetical protein
MKRQLADLLVGADRRDARHALRKNASAKAFGRKEKAGFEMLVEALGRG